MYTTSAIALGSTKARNPSLFTVMPSSWRLTMGVWAQSRRGSLNGAMCKVPLLVAYCLCFALVWDRATVGGSGAAQVPLPWCALLLNWPGQGENGPSRWKEPHGHLGWYGGGQRGAKFWCGEGPKK